MPKLPVISMVGRSLAYSVIAGNVHDSQAFPALFAQLKAFQPTYLIADAGYKTPTIAHYLLSQKVIPVFPYTRPHGKKTSYVLRISVMMTIMAVTFALKIRC